MSLFQRVFEKMLSVRCTSQFAESADCGNDFSNKL